ncbi:MAG: peptidylprolyl isomerase [Rhodoferax sp.]|nr:peptidylprolyl isomerase [Rhodoferax sp.]MCP5263908.1 peptidylprolyl isomerase [Rhodoferax sp.]
MNEHTPTVLEAPVATINGIALHAPGESLGAEALRQRACTELLRQAAQQAGLLAPNDAGTADGVISEAASDAIDTLIAQQVIVPEPTEQACERHYQAHAADYRSGEKVHARHILFALTQGMDVVPLRDRAEACLLDVRCHDGSSNTAFARAARELSNCPSGADGGDLGWLTRDDVAPELARELFGQAQVCVLPRLVHSRFGLHVVEILAREPGQDPTYAAVRGAVAMALRQHSFVTALRQYLQLLAGQAHIVGVDLEAADTPLVQ